MTTAEALDIVKKPRHRDAIEEARHYESRLTLFTQPLFRNEAVKEPAWTKDMCDLLKEPLGEKKFKRIIKLFRFPLPATELTEKALNELNRVYEARNSSFSWSFESETAQQSFDSITREVGLRNWIQQSGEKVIRNRPNSIVVIDFDKDGGKSAPRLILVTSDRLHDTDAHGEGNMTYVAFKHSAGKMEMMDGSKEKFVRMAVYDEEFYRVFIRVGDGDWTLEVENEHQAGECPARMFRTRRLNDRNPFLRDAPLSKSIGRLYQWTIFDTFSYYADHYGPWPFTERIVSKCKNEDCIDGRVKKYATGTGSSDSVPGGENQPQQIRYSWEDCQICTKSPLMGPGTDVKHIAPSHNEQYDPIGKLQVLGLPQDGLERIDEKQDHLADEIHENVTGQAPILNDEAVNRWQARSVNESRRSVLLELKKDHDIIGNWLVHTMAKLIFGPSIQVSTNINFGTEWYLLTEEEALKQFETLKDAGMPESEKDEAYTEWMTTRYKSLPDLQQRQILLKQIDPAPYDNLETFNTKVAQGLFTTDEIELKQRFQHYIDRFEREEGSILEFGANLESAQARVEAILTVLFGYIEERRQATLEETEGNAAERDAQAKLRALVGSVTVIRDINAAIKEGTMEREAAIGILVNALGYPKDRADQMLNKGTGDLNQNQ